MTPQERLKAIESQEYYGVNDCDWLIQRVKTLEKALEDIKLIEDKLNSALEALKSAGNITQEIKLRNFIEEIVTEIEGMK